MTKTQTVAASDARNNFSDLISKVQYKGEEFLIERYGEVVAKIVSVETKEATDGSSSLGSSSNSSNSSNSSAMAQTLADKAEEGGGVGAKAQAEDSKQSVNQSQKSQSDKFDKAVKAAEAGSDVGSAGGSVSDLAELRAKYQRITMAQRQRAASDASDVAQTTVSKRAVHSDIWDNEKKSEVDKGEKEKSTKEGDEEKSKKVDEAGKSDSSWTALKRLEELISAQKMKNSKTNINSSQPENDSRNANSRITTSLSTSWPESPIKHAKKGVDDKQNDQPEIIRKKIEL